MKSALIAVLVALSLVACGEKPAVDAAAVAASAAVAAPVVAEAASSVAALLPALQALLLKLLLQQSTNLCFYSIDIKPTQVGFFTPVILKLSHANPTPAVDQPRRPNLHYIPGLDSMRLPPVSGRLFC